MYTSSGVDNNFQRRFVELAVRRLPHHMLLTFSSKRSDEGVTKLLNAYAKKRFLKHKNSDLQYSSTEQESYVAVAGSTPLWHGTGRFQYGTEGIRDVFMSILSDGGLKPAYDAYDVLSGGAEMHSVSLTPHRILARSYADTHGRGNKESNRYGDALTWASYYYGLFYARVYVRNATTLHARWKKWHRLTHNEQGQTTWGKKVHKDARYVWDTFGLGSDIPGNYPILFGVRRIENEVELSPVFRDCEVRTSTQVSIASITHIEVPHNKVADVASALAAHGLDLPIFPIELGETIASRQTFGGLLGLARQARET